VACIFEGCTVGPEYERPEIEMPGSWREISQDPNSIADIYWADFFKDKTLLSLIQTAIDNNKDLLTAAARIDEFRGTYHAVYGKEFPEFGFSGNASRSQSSQYISPTAKPTDNFKLVGELLWEVDIWGKLKHGTDAARADLLSTEQGYKAVILILVSDIANTYFDIQDLDRRIEITKHTINTRHQSLELAKKRFEGGLTSELEVKQADSELASALAVIPRLRNNLDIAENSLSVLLGQSPSEPPRGRNRTGLNLPPVVPAGLPNELLRRRPDILQAEQLLIAACHRIGVAEAEFYPSLSLSGLIGQEAPHFSSLFDSTANLWKTTASTAAPIFSFGRLEGNLESVKAKYEQARLQYEQSILNALREVNNALSAYNESIEQRKAQEYLIKANTDYARLAFAKYQNGEVGYLEYLDAQRKLFDAELSLSQAIRDQFTSLVFLYKALGGGWHAGRE
jgi:multidrug efflux system outer membrane protein